MRTYFNIWSCVNILIHSRHWMLNLIFKLLEIIAYVTSCFHICLGTSEFKIPSRSYWSKIFHRKVARGNRWMAFESHSILDLRVSSMRQPRIERGGGMKEIFERGKGWSHNGPDFGNFWRYLQPLPPLFHQRCLWCIYKGINGSHVAPPSAYNELCWWYQPLITFAKHF